MTPQARLNTWISLSTQESPRWEVFVYLAYCYLDLQEYELACKACQASMDIRQHISAISVCCDAYVKRGMYDEALSLLNFDLENANLKMEVAKHLIWLKVWVLRRLDRWESLSDTLKQLKNSAGRIIHIWEPCLDVILALANYNLGHFKEAEEFVSAGFLNSPTGKDKMDLHLISALAMLKRGKTSSALAECQKANQVSEGSDEDLNWRAIGYELLKYGEDHAASICFDLELRTTSTTAHAGEDSILVHQPVPCDNCKAEDFVGRRYIRKTLTAEPLSSYELCENCFLQHVGQNSQCNEFFRCPSSDPEVLAEVERLHRPNSPLPSFQMG